MARDVLVDRLKGYACFLVLFGHVIRGVRQAGVDIPSFFEGVEQFIWSFHVALFLFLSGVVYKITGEWRSRQTKPRFILHKLCTLGIPYAVFSAVYIAINSLVGQANTQSSLGDILYIWRTPVAQYWFLYALFFLFCIWTLFSGVLKNWVTALLAVLVGYLAPLCGISLGCFEVVFYSALAFGLGTFVDFHRLLRLPLWAKVTVVCAHVAAGVVTVLLGVIEAPYVKELMLVFGIYASMLLLSMIHTCKPISRFLDFINRYSFQIYLLHTIFTAGTRILLQQVGITQWWLHVVAGTVIGIVLSVLAAKIAQRFAFLNFFFFPRFKKAK